MSLPQVTSVVTPSSLRRVSAGHIPGVGTGTLYSKFKSTAIVIKLDHENTTRMSIFDTGASVSLIDSALVKDFDINPQPIIALQGLGTSITLGFVTLPFVIPATDLSSAHYHMVDLVFKHDFHVVPNLVPGVILANDFIYPREIQINCGALTATLGAKYSWKLWPLRQVTSVDGNTEWIVDVEPRQATTGTTLTVKQDTLIPALHHAWVPVQPNHALTPGPISVSPAAWQLAHSDLTFCVQGSIINPDRSHVLVTNVGTSDGVIPSNMPLCQAWPLQECATEASGSFSLQHLEVPVQSASCYALENDDATSVGLDDLDDAEDTEKKAALVADKTTLIDNKYHVGSAISPDIVTALREFADVFAFDGKPGHVTHSPMTIPLIEGAILRPEAPRKVSPAKRDVIDAKIDKYLADDIIEESSSPTSYPVHLVRQGAKWRMCVDYRGLNLQTVDDKYPLPRMDEIFETLGQGRVFSSVDAVSGYNQLDLAPEDKWKTAFVSHRGLYQYKRVPFGLKNAPAHFQRFMDALLGAMRWKTAMVYLDDAVIFSRTVEEHVSHLREFFEKCRSVGLKLSPDKCFFAVTSLHLLGRLISVDGVSIIPDRAEAIRRLSPPTNLQEVYRMLGLFNYYRPFIPRFAELASRLTAKTRGTKYSTNTNNQTELSIDDEVYKSAKSVPVTCDEEDLKAIGALKEALCKQVTLAFPDRDKPWFLYVDASKDAYAAALHQQFERPMRDSEVDSIGEYPVVVSLPSNLPDTAEIARLQRQDPLWAKAIASLKGGEDPIKGYALLEGCLVRVDTDTVCLPQGMVALALEDAHSGHSGFKRTYARMLQTWYHPSLLEKTHAYVKWCPTCLRTKSVRSTGRLDIEDDFLGLPFHTISMDLMLGLPGQKDACLIILDTFSKMVLLHPMTSSATASQIAHAFEQMVLRKGWSPSRIISDGDTRFCGKIAQEIAKRIGARLTPSAPYHQAANPVERYVQTVKNTLKAAVLDQEPERWPDQLLAVEVSLNSTPSTVTDFAPFDLVYVPRPKLLTRLTEHSGTGSIVERLGLSKARLDKAAAAMAKARETQKRRYDSRRRPLPDLKVGDHVMIRLKDRPLYAGRQMRTGLDPDLEGPWKVKKILSDHRVELDLPPDVKVKQPFDVSHLQKLPEGDDPFDRERLAVEDADAFYEPQRILEERMRDNLRQYYVKWRGSSRMTWEYEDDLLEYGCSDVIARWQEEKDHLQTPPPPDVFVTEPHFGSAQDAVDNQRRPLKQPTPRVINGVKCMVIEKPVAFSSRETTKGEKKLAAIELEASALAWAYTKFLPFFEGCPVTVVTDHSPLGAVMKGTAANLASPTLLRARNRMAPYVHLITFHHRAGNTHTNVDALSRLRVDAE